MGIDKGGTCIMAYDFLHFEPGTDVLPVDYSWLDKKELRYLTLTLIHLFIKVGSLISMTLNIHKKLKYWLQKVI